MSNMLVLKTNIFEAQAVVVILFCRSTWSRPCSFLMYCSFFNISFVWCTVNFLCSNFFFQHSTSSSEAGHISDSSIGHKTSNIFHMPYSVLLIPFLSLLTHVFSASTLTLATCTLSFEVSTLFPHFLAHQLLTESFILLAFRLLSLCHYSTLSSI